MPRKSTKKVVKKRLPKKSDKKSKDGKIIKVQKETKKFKTQHQPEQNQLDEFNLENEEYLRARPTFQPERMRLDLIEMNEPEEPIFNFDEIPLPSARPLSPMRRARIFDDEDSEEEGPLTSVRPLSPIRRPRIFDSDEEEEAPLPSVRPLSPIRRPRFYESDEDEWIV